MADIAEPMFPVGAYVFARMTGFRPWPARVKEVIMVKGHFKYYVRFYGTYDYWCPETSIFPYNQRVRERNEKSTNRRLQALYERSILEIEEDLAFRCDELDGDVHR